MQINLHGLARIGRVRVRWAPSAERLLQQRDRFTQQAIRQEFEDAVRVEPVAYPCIPFDHVFNGFLTPVADDRYTVVWYEETGEAVVHAVVPTTRFSPDMTDLKERVRNIVQRESHGTVDVK
jgi:hypothetical protein